MSMPQTYGLRAMACSKREEGEKRGGLAASTPPGSLYERFQQGVKPTVTSPGLNTTPIRRRATTPEKGGGRQYTLDP